MTGKHPVRESDGAGLLAAAQDDQESVLALTRELVRIPSRGGIDDYAPILGAVEQWIGTAGLPHRRLCGEDGADLGLVCEVQGSGPGPRLVVDACVDTAPFGDEGAWSEAPTSASVRDGWCYGRGTADSKVGAAIFLHLATRIARERARFRGELVVLLDVDEHTGGFGGAKAFMADVGQRGGVDGVMIGYPGADHVVIGGRGVLRARLAVHGISSHSGGRAATPNAISKAAALVAALDQPLPEISDPSFAPQPKLSVTEIHGGQGYAQTPDLAYVHVDVRLTPRFDEAAASQLLRERSSALDAIWPDTEPTRIEIAMSWPPYRLGDDHRLSTALLKAAHDVGLQTAPKIAGPSNIGNYLAGLGVPATAGFGVEYEGLHATDERIRLDSIPLVQAAYHRALLELLR